MTAGKSRPKPHVRTVRRRTSAVVTWLRGAALEHFWLKLFSLGLALTLYNVVHSTRNAQRTIQVPIVADMPPPNAARTLVTAIPESVSVTLEGPRQQLDTLESARLDPIPLNLRAAKDGEVRFSLDMIDGLPSGVRVNRIIPASLSIRWENVIALELTVQVPLTGQLQKGMELVSVTVLPEHVTASGPESVVKSIQLARTEPLDVSGLGEGSHSRSLPIRAMPSRIELGTSTVEVTALVKRKLVTRDYDVKVQVVGLPRARTEPAVVRVTVEATPERIESLRADSVVARVEPKSGELDLAHTGSALLPISIDVPDANVTVSPARVLVRW